IVSIMNGLADLDTDGDGAADDPATLAALGITDDERRQVASLYSPGQSLWRVPIPHFSPFDFNWPFSGPPPDATPPGQPPPRPDDKRDDDWIGRGSVIEVANQVLGESTRVTGTPFRLHYQSDRVPGRTAARSIRIRLSRDSIPSSLTGIALEVSL